MSVLNYPTAHSLSTLFTAVVTATEITASTRHLIHVTILLSLYHRITTGDRLCLQRHGTTRNRTICVCSTWWLTTRSDVPFQDAQGSPERVCKRREHHFSGAFSAILKFWSRDPRNLEKKIRNTHMHIVGVLSNQILPGTVGVQV